MKLKKTKSITKTIRTYEIHPELSARLETIHEGDKLISTSLIGKGVHGSYPLIVKPEFWDYVKKMSPWASVRGKYGISEYSVSPKDLSPDLEVDPKNLVYIYGSGNLIFDSKGNVVPIPYLFDYIGTPFSNEISDLEAMLPHLKEHPWVVNRDELYIDDVPYYNNDGGWRKYIRGKEAPYVIILPDFDSINEIYQEALAKDKEFFSVRMQEFVLGDMYYNWKTTKVKDYMGIRQFYAPHRKSDL